MLWALAELIWFKRFSSLATLFSVRTHLSQRFLKIFIKSSHPSRLLVWEIIKCSDSHSHSRTSLFSHHTLLPFFKFLYSCTIIYSNLVFFWFWGFPFAFFFCSIHFSFSIKIWGRGNNALLCSRRNSLFFPLLKLNLRLIRVNLCKQMMISLNLSCVHLISH